MRRRGAFSKALCCLTSSSVLALTACASSPTPSATFSGEAVPYAGEVPWSGAVIQSSDSRTVTVYADGDSIKGSVFVCGLPQEKAVVSEANDRVAITVEGYATPLPEGVACGGVGHPEQQIAVTLDAPLGDRALVDVATGKRHVPLRAWTVPTATRLPEGFEIDARRPLRWDDEADTSSRTWFAGTAENPAIAALVLTDSPTPTAPDLTGERLPDVRIAGATAAVSHYRDVYSWILTLRWPVSRTRSLTLFYRGEPKDHLDLAAVLRVARSVR